MNSARTLTDAALELGKDAIDSVEGWGRSAGEKLDNAREETVDALREAAASVRSTSRQSCAAIDHVAGGTATRLDATASFLQDFEARDAFTGMRKFAHRHLTGSLVTAAAFGLFAGIALSRSTHSRSRKSEDV